MSYVFRFGKYKNKDITKVPTSYLKYLLANNPAFYGASIELGRRKDLSKDGLWVEPRAMPKA